MPVLDLPPLLLPDAALYLTSVMFYPRDLQRQRKFLTILKNTAVSDFVGRHRPRVQEFLRKLRKCWSRPKRNHLNAA
jgi:hypothetical protein